jgi:hypothetical protein
MYLSLLVSHTGTAFKRYKSIVEIEKNLREAGFFMV